MHKIPTQPRKKIKTSKQYRQEQEQELAKLDLESEKKQAKLRPKRQSVKPAPQPVQTKSSLKQNNNNQMINSGDKSPQKSLSFSKKDQLQNDDTGNISLDKSVTLKKDLRLEQNNTNLEKTLPGGAFEGARKIEEMKKSLFNKQNQYGALPDLSEENNTQPMENSMGHSFGQKQQLQVNQNQMQNSNHSQKQYGKDNVIQLAEKAFNEIDKEIDPSYSDDKFGLSPMPDHSRNLNFSQITAVRKASQMSGMFGQERRESLQTMKQKQIAERELRIQQELEAKKRKKEEALEKRRDKTKKEKLIRIQATCRMYLAKLELRKLKRKFELLSKENKAQNELRDFESQCVDNYYSERNNVFISDKFSKTFQQPQGPGTLASLGDLRHNTFYPTLFKALAEQGNLDILIEEKESEAQFNSQQKYKLSRPKTVESKTGFVHQYYEKPQKEDEHLKTFKGLSQNYMTELQATNKILYQTHLQKKIIQKFQNKQERTQKKENLIIYQMKFNQDLQIKMNKKQIKKQTLQEHNQTMNIEQKIKLKIVTRVISNRNLIQVKVFLEVPIKLRLNHHQFHKKKQQIIIQVFQINQIQLFQKKIIYKKALKNKIVQDLVQQMIQKKVQAKYKDNPQAVYIKNLLE